MNNKLYSALAQDFKPLQEVRHLLNRRETALNEVSKLGNQIKAICDTLDLRFDPADNLITGSLDVRIGAEPLPTTTPGTSIVEPDDKPELSLDEQETEEDSAGATSAYKRVLAFLESKKGLYLTSKQIAQDMEGPAPSRVDRILRRLIREGKIQKFGSFSSARYRYHNRAIFTYSLEWEQQVLEAIKACPGIRTETLLSLPTFAEFRKHDMARILMALRVKQLVVVKGNTRGTNYTAC